MLPQAADRFLNPLFPLLAPAQAEQQAPLGDPSTWPPDPHRQFAKRGDKQHAAMLATAAEVVSALLPERADLDASRRRRLASRPACCSHPTRTRRRRH